MPVSTTDLAAYKARGTKFVMLTAYDYPTARVLGEAGIPVLLVGDSVGQVMLGYDSTIPVTMEEMLHHTKAVARGAGNALIVGDMPFGAYQVSDDQGVENAIRFLKAGAHSVKIEGPRIDLAAKLASSGIPVMGHLGLTPQSVHLFGGYKVQGRTAEQADNILRWSKELEEAGCFALVLECVPAELGKAVTSRLSIPTIGIGAGPDTDAQVLVIHDLVGFKDTPDARFVKRYADVRPVIADAARAFAAEVAAGQYPGPEHSYE
jgi:3-methyl-2-oxobutanoate hydroxymethyltransferase